MNKIISYYRKTQKEFEESLQELLYNYRIRQAEEQLRIDRENKKTRLFGHSLNDHFNIPKKFDE